MTRADLELTARRRAGGTRRRGGRQAALLRGVNVGSAKRVAMADLRALVESLGFATCAPC